MEFISHYSWQSNILHIFYLYFSFVAIALGIFGAFRITHQGLILYALDIENLNLKRHFFWGAFAMTFAIGVGAAADILFLLARKTKKKHGMLRYKGIRLNADEATRAAQWLESLLNDDQEDVAWDKKTSIKRKHVLAQHRGLAPIYENPLAASLSEEWAKPRKDPISIRAKRTFKTEREIDCIYLLEESKSLMKINKNYKVKTLNYYIHTLLFGSADLDKTPLENRKEKLLHLLFSLLVSFACPGLWPLVDHHTRIIII
ncbi:hypothetical protein ACJX0J_011815, partial [Zea mays]